MVNAVKYFLIQLYRCQFSKKRKTIFTATCQSCINLITEFNESQIVKLEKLSYRKIQ